MQVRRWTQLPKMLVVIGLIAAAYSMYARDARRASSAAIVSNAVTPFYPGPCTTAPKAVSLTYSGPLSGCTDLNGKGCSASEAIEFTATSPSYTFSTCDKFTWTFGDGTSVQTLWPSISHQFVAGKPRIATLTVVNDFGSTTATSVVDIPQSGGSSCKADANTLCLENGRYQVTLDAINTLGDKKTTLATAKPVTDIFGFMSFPELTSNADNPEVFVKVLTFTDGKTWVFYGGLTNLEYFINIYDTKNGNTIQLHTPPPPPSQPNRSIGSFNLGGVTPPACSDVTVTTRTVTGATCSTTDPNSFCLLNRFKVSMQARDGNPGGTASGPGVKVATGSTSNLYGFFSLPALTNNPANVEFFTKILDASSINQGYWLFFGGLTNFEYTVTVTDTTNGKTKDYFKPQGSTCGRNEAPAFPF